MDLGGQFKSGQLGSDQNRPTEVARNCKKFYPIVNSSSKVNRVFFLKALKKSHSEVRSRIFSRSPMVLVMAFPALRGQFATWFSSSAVHI
jgi:hypothetical protein